MGEVTGHCYISQSQLFCKFLPIKHQFPSTYLFLAVPSNKFTCTTSFPQSAIGHTVVKDPWSLRPTSINLSTCSFSKNKLV